MKKIFIIAISLSMYFFSKSQENLYYPKDSAFISKLKKDFIKTFGKDFEWVNAEIKKAYPAKHYWVATIKPKDTGIFIIRYQYNVDNNELYDSDKFKAFTHGDNEFKIKVIKQVETAGEIIPTITTIALDEYLLIPIKIDKAYSNHIFLSNSRLKEECPDNYSFSETDSRHHKKHMFQWNNSTLTPELSYYKSDSVYTNVINPSMHVLSYNISQDLFFKANVRGKTTFEITSHTFLLDKHSLNYIHNLTKMQYTVIVVDKNDPVYRLPEIEKEYRYKKNDNNHSEKENIYYPHQVKVIRTGEIFEFPVLQAFNIPMHLEQNVVEIFKNNPFDIKKIEFSQHPILGKYGSWIIDKY